ncbi:MAG TPA: ADOP family duplicated permease, partial [Gemmatimonadaceae bacterium]|nr:ADOP family duplicated permease [Gemmatimonadaceae bacterium]
DKVHTVVGVLPPLPGYPNENDIWMPAGACPFRSDPSMMAARDMRMVEAYAVLSPGASLERARAELAAVGSRFHTAYPAAYPAEQRLRFVADGAREEMTARAKPILFMLLATAAFLLVAAGANVANLSLARQMRRARELALRVALGAGRARLYRQLAFESLLLAFAGGAIGVMLAADGVGLLRSLATRITPRADEIHIDATVLVFAFALCVFIGVVIAAAPFAHSLGRRNVADALRQGNTGAMGTRGDIRLRGMLVVAQVAIACVMLVGAGLIGRSLLALERVDAGVDVSNVLTARLTLNFTKYNTPALRRNMVSALLERLNGMPGVSTASVASDLPLNNGRPSNVRFQIEGLPTDPKAAPHSDVTAVGPDYFKAVGIPLLRGRAFTTSDRDTVDRFEVISSRLAKAYWNGRDPIGTRVSPDSGKTWLTVVGVVGDVRQNRLDADVTDEVYLSVYSNPPGDVRVFLRTTGPVPPVIKALRAIVHDIDPQQPVSSVQTLEQVRGAQLAEPRLTTTLLSAFAALALVLTATGLAGVIAYGVTQRLPEIAIRMALGATGPRVLRLVMRDGLAIVFVGLAVGLTVSWFASRLVAKLLFHVTTTDVATYASVAALVIGTACIACLIPSRRALHADPTQVFRGG